jgi:hypothetical protein
VKVSDEGGKNARNSTIGLHVDHHAMWIDPVDPDRMIVGNDGGIGISYDKGGNYIFPNTFAIGQFYNVSFDMAVPYRVCGGLQDNGSWCGPSRRRQGPITNAMWFTYNGGDGFVTQQDPTDPDIIYGESQGGNMGRYIVSAGQRTALRKPNYRDQYMQWEDSIMVVRGDTTRPMTAAMRRTIADLRARQVQDSTDASLRWNWNTPVLPLAAQPVRGLHGRQPRDEERQARRRHVRHLPGPDVRGSGEAPHLHRDHRGHHDDATRAETFGTIVSLNESPFGPGGSTPGTDDGRLWITRQRRRQLDGAHGQRARRAGRHVRVADRAVAPRREHVLRHLRQPPARRLHAVRVRHARRRRDVPVDRRRAAARRAGLRARDPRGPREPDLLFVGTDVGAYVSGDRGTTWQPFMTGCPNVPVHDLKIHPRDAELIAGTHGRSIWIVDIAPLQQMTSAVASAPAHLFAPRTGIQWGEPPIGGESTGNMLFRAPSPAYGADIWYKLSRSGGPTRIVIQDAAGDTVQTLTGMGGAGLHKVTWSYQGRPEPRPALTGAALRDSILAARRMETALDSIEKAGTVPKPALDMIRRNLAGGTQGMQAMARAFGFAGGGGGGGGQPQPGVWVERPAEQAPAPARGPGGRPGGAPGAGGPTGGLDQSDLFAIMRAIGVTGGGGGRGFGGGGSVAEPGTYLVSMTVDGQTYRQTLRVERAAGGGASGFPFEVEAMMKEYERYMRDR